MYFSKKDHLDKTCQEQAGWHLITVLEHGRKRSSQPELHETLSKGNKSERYVQKKIVYSHEEQRTHTWPRIHVAGKHGNHEQRPRGQARAPQGHCPHRE